MRSGYTLVGGAVALAIAVFVAPVPADARCTRLAFSVNDYGKDGPTRDAKDLLDKYIADWTRAKGIKTYTVGKKDVSCELYLDFGVFDEHTCKASALVCWPDGKGPAETKSTPATPAATSKAPG